MVAHDAGASNLYGSVTHDGDYQMPAGAPKLPEPSLETVRRWIEAGGPLAAVPENAERTPLTRTT